MLVHLGKSSFQSKHPMKPLKISLLTYGTRGDVEPFLALADGLIASGHHVTLAAPETLQPLVENDQLRYQGLPGDPAQLADELRERAGGNLIKIISAMTRHVMPIAVEVFRGVQTACRGADVILHSFLMTEVGHTLAHRRGAVEISVQFFPVFQPTGQFPAPVFPDLPLGDGYRKLTHHFNTIAFRYGGRIMYRLLRRKHDDLPRLAKWPFRKGTQGTVPMFFAFSEHVIPRPTEWPDQTVITGYWRRKPSIEWTPPPELISFLTDHEAPVFIGLGSMVPHPGEEIIQLVRRALETIDEPGIISHSGHSDHAPQRRGNALIIGPIPHDWILPQTRVVVHHGGAGTTGAVMHAGVPGVVLPVSADQFFWGRRTQALGVGPEPVPFKKLTAHKLSQAVNKALQDSTLHARARQLGKQLQAEDGVVHAVEVIERLYTKCQAEVMLAA